MRRHTTSALWAGLIVAIAVAGKFAEIGTVGPGGWLTSIAAVPSLPGFYAALFLGLGRGAHGFPSHADVAPHLLTFLLWWLLIDRGLALWQRRRAQTVRTPPSR